MPSCCSFLHCLLLALAYTCKPVWSQTSVNVTPMIAAARLGTACPERSAYVPEQTLGIPWPSVVEYQIEETMETVRFAVGQPDDFQAECCSSGRIVTWTIATTKEHQNIARVNATCSDGQQISTPLYGYNGTRRVDGVLRSWFCKQDISDAAQTLYQPDEEGVFPYEVTNWVTSFLGFGNSTLYTSGRVSASCPIGTRAIGIGARSSCYAILGLQVVCARLIEIEATQNDHGGVLQRDTHCSVHTSIASNTTLADPLAWDARETTGDTFQQVQSAVNKTQTDCCPIGEGIVSWTIAVSRSDAGNYTGLIQGMCTDNTLLAAVKYGYNGTDRSVCNQQKLSDVYHYATPKSQQFFYSTSSGNLVSFIAPSSPDLGNRSHIACPQGQAAVGYSAASSCYSLQNISVLCGRLSDSARTKLAESGSPEANPPKDVQAGLCPGGLSVAPDDTYRNSLTKHPIGKVGAWKRTLDETVLASPNVTIYTANASPLMAACCPSGQGIKGFNVWASDSVQRSVGKLSAVCSPFSDGTQSTTTKAIAFGFNGTLLNGTTLFCPNSTIDEAYCPMPDDGSWAYRYSGTFMRLFEWPLMLPGTGTIWTAFGGETVNLRCPSQQYPVGFAARSSCWSLADFRVICGRVNFKTSPKPGISPSGEAGIAVAIVLAAALTALLVGMFMFRRHKRMTCITSRQLFNLNGPAGFYSGTGSASAGRASSQSSLDFNNNCRLITDGILTIQGIDRSKDDSPLSFDGIPPEWRLKANQLKLYCSDGQPIELGRGGFGVVLYGIVHKEDAAIKMIKGRSNESKLLKEIAILGRTNTKYVVRFLGYSGCKEGVLLAMEYLPGGTLWQALRRGKEFQWYDKGRQAFQDICKGLYLLHSNRIAHLDMKSPNILIAEDGTCKISDLGLGKFMRADANTCSGEGAGSFAWIGPEQMMGRCGFSSDIWALSTIIWEICTLREPTREARAAEIQVPEQAPQAIVDLMTACRQKIPEDRPLIGTICDLLEI